ncbi:MAG: LysR family transcriptional regulator [Deltaproteobacteria bacterium]|nr:LysR family transcriptional regulator [Deltaproteobacteria bacterium]
MMIDEISGDLLQWLRGFYCVAAEGSLRQAAIAMGREKATISRQIHCLEKELGVNLFDRSSGKMVITPKGKMLQEEAAGLFEYLQRIKDEIKNEEINYRGKIFIAATHTIIDNILPPYIVAFQRQHPDVTFQLEGTIRGVVYEKVESAEADLGIAYFDTYHKTLVCHDLFEASLIMIAPKNNSYFSGTALPTLKQIAAAPLIISTYRGLHEALIEDRFAKERLKPKVVMIHNNFASIKKYVAQGMGVAILGRHDISPEDEQHFDIYNLDRYFSKRKYVILLKKNKYLSPMLKAFLQAIKPDIDFSADLEPSGEAKPVQVGKGKKR